MPGSAGGAVAVVCVSAHWLYKYVGVLYFRTKQKQESGIYCLMEWLLRFFFVNWMLVHIDSVWVLFLKQKNYCYLVNLKYFQSGNVNTHTHTHCSSARFVL